MVTSVQRRGFGLVKKDLKPDRERSRTIRARQRAIGRELRRMFDDVAQESVPDDFVQLLREIDEQKSGGGGNS